MDNITFKKNMVSVIMALFFAVVFAGTLQAQDTKTITGKVTDSYTNIPLEGVTIQVRGTAVTVQTEKDGTYSIDVPKGSKSLMISAGGYIALVMEIGDREVINVVMTEDAANDPSLW